MGERYFLEITCPQCGFHDDDVYYAPTCGFIDWKCQKCGRVIDLEEYTGISREEASNVAEIEAIINAVKSNKACTRPAFGSGTDGESDESAGG